MKLQLLVEIGEYNGTMGLKITNNNKVIYSAEPNILESGTATITVDVTQGPVCIEGTGKGAFDTLTDRNQTVLKDKYIEITGIAVDGFELQRFHIYHSSKFFKTYFDKNDIKKFILPDGKDLLLWYLQILEDHELSYANMPK